MGLQRILMSVIVAMVLAEPLSTVADQAQRGLRNMVYVSPTWGYSVRWYSNEWTVDQEASQAGVDSLWLSDEAGNAVRFEGREDCGGDARACLDDQYAAIQAADSIGDVAVLEDESGRPQKYYHPWRSWILLIAGYDNGSGAVDHVLYLDCRTLVPDDAVVIRMLIAPAAILSNELEQLDILNVAMPRSAWSGSAFKPLSAPGLDKDWAPPPLSTDSIWPWLYPDDPKLLASTDGIELGMMAQVDGDPNGNTYIVMIENSGEGALTIDPEAFTESNDPTSSGPDPDLKPVRTSWDDGAPSGLRTILPGTKASLTLEFDPGAQDRLASFLGYWDSALYGGYVMLDCLTSCGYGGGGSRPKIRLSR